MDAKGLSTVKKTLIGLAVSLMAVGLVGASGSLLGTLTVTQAVIAFEVPIDIMPGSDTNPINPNNPGKIPVAILSTPDFDATTEVDKTSLTFGRTGDENSLSKCSENADVNGDGRDDVVCSFETQDTGFVMGDTEGILRGRRVDSTPFEGRDSVIIVGG